MFTHLVLFILTSSLTSLPAPEAVGHVYNIEVTRIIDGDTIVFEAPFLPSPLKPELSIRVFGVDTPEKSWRAGCEKEKKLAEKASAFTETQLKESTNHQILLMKWDKYGGRVIGDVLLDGQSLRKMLIDNKLAVEYFGEAKSNWCEEKESD